MLMDLGSAVLSYQRTDEGMYEYASPTPGKPNFCSESADSIIVGLLSIVKDIFGTCGQLAEFPWYIPQVCSFDPSPVAEEYSPAVVCPNTCGDSNATEDPSALSMGFVSFEDGVQRGTCL